MVCVKCRGVRCNNCDGTGKANALPVDVLILPLGGKPMSIIKQDCLTCEGQGRTQVDHDSCREENKERGFANCDCQHRLPGSQSAFLQPK